MDDLLLVAPGSPVLRGGEYRFQTGALTVVTGPSGSGKSALVWDALYGEGRRRLLDMMLPGLGPYVPWPAAGTKGRLDGLSLMQGLSGGERGRESQAAALCGILPLLVRLFAHESRGHCPFCGEEVRVWTGDELVTDLLEKVQGEEVWLWVPLVTRRRGNHTLLLEQIRRQGFLRVRVDGDMLSLEDGLPRLDRHQVHSIDLLLDVLEIGPETRAALLHTLDEAQRWQPDRLIATWSDHEEQWFLEPVCSACGERLTEGRAHLFAPDGTLPSCPDCGGGGEEPCSCCGGSGLHPRLEQWTWRGKSLPELLTMNVTALERELEAAQVPGQGVEGTPGLRLMEHLSLLKELELGHLNLSWRSRSLSPGTVQRCRLAALVAERPAGMTLILDDPLSGDSSAAIRGLNHALDLFLAWGNTVVLVASQKEVLQRADRLLALEKGGDAIPYQGSPGGEQAGPGTSASEKREIRAGGETVWLHLGPVSGGILEGLRCSLPHNRLTVCSGPSGSGKSTLLSLLLHTAPEDAKGLGGGLSCPVRGRRISGRGIHHGWDPFAGNSPISLLHFLGLDHLFAHLMASQPRALALGLTQESFLRQKREGRCPHCQGRGETILRMKGGWVRGAKVCQHCQGTGLNPRALLIRYGSLSFGAFLETSFARASEHLDFLDPFRKVCDLLARTGLSYLLLGQSLASLSQGERQRIRLLTAMREALSCRNRLVLMDEPGRGIPEMELEPIQLLWNELLGLGHTLVVVDRQVQVLAQASHRIVLGRRSGGRNPLRYQGPGLPDRGDLVLGG